MACGYAPSLGVITEYPEDGSDLCQAIQISIWFSNFGPGGTAGLTTSIATSASKSVEGVATEIIREMYRLYPSHFVNFRDDVSLMDWRWVKPNGMLLEWNDGVDMNDIEQVTKVCKAIIVIWNYPVLEDAPPEGNGYA